MSKPAKKKHLRKIEVTTNGKGGFTVWVTEKRKTDGRKVRHWILDGSLLHEEGKIYLGNKNLYRINAEYNEHERAIYVTRRGSKL